MKRAPIRDIIWLFLATRFALVMVTYFSYIILTQNQYSYTPTDIRTLLETWNHWDALNYIRIAQYGYQTRLDLVFFPLYPLLISGPAHMLGAWSYFPVAFLLSNLALLGLLCVLYQLAVDTGGEQVARRSLLYLCIFPTAFFFFAPYNESLFILLTASTFLTMRRQRWFLAGILGLLSALTRNAGILLIVPFVYEAWIAREHILADWKKTLPLIGSLCLIPLGTLLFCIYCWYVTGDPFVFATQQGHWGRHLSFPWQSIWQGLVTLFWSLPFGSANEAHVLLDLSATLAFGWLIWLGRHTLRTSYTLWMMVLFLYFLLSPATQKPDWLMSNQRFVLELFPAFITLASLGIRHLRLHQALLIVFPTLLATLSVLFVMNRWLV